MEQINFYWSLLIAQYTVVSISCSVWLQLLFILSYGREDKPCLSGGGTTSSSSQLSSSSYLSSSSQSNVKGGTSRLTNKRSKPGLSSRFETWPAARTDMILVKKIYTAVFSGQEFYTGKMCTLRPFHSRLMSEN